MDHARLTGSTLLIAKLDRFSRDAHFLLGLQKAGVPPVACDMPDANNLTAGILTLVAQQERQAISQRTKAALAAANPRNQARQSQRCPLPLRICRGPWQPHQQGDRGAQGRRSATRRRPAGNHRPDTCRGIAKALTEAHVETPRGGAWTTRSVLNVTARQS
jgi:hypothetical protein